MFELRPKNTALSIFILFVAYKYLTIFPFFVFISFVLV